MNDVASESFGVLLREKLAELDADETPTPLVIEDDPVERLRFDARQAIKSDAGGPMTRSGHQAYVAAPVPPVEEAGRKHVDIKY